MSSATFVQNGHQIDYTPATSVAAGEVVVLGDLVGIAKSPIAANTPGALAVEDVFDVPKASGASTAIVVGTTVYWDAAQKVAKADSESGANKLLGKTVRAAADGDTTVRVRLSQ